MAERDHHVCGRDEVFGRQILGVVFHLAAALTHLALTKLLLDGRQLVADDGGNPLRLAQNIEQVFNLTHHLFVFGHDFVLLKARQTLQTHLQNFLSLGVRQAVQALGAHAVSLI